MVSCYEVSEIRHEIRIRIGVLILVILGNVIRNIKKQTNNHHKAGEQLPHIGNEWALCPKHLSWKKSVLNSLYWNLSICCDSDKQIGVKFMSCTNAVT